MKKLVLALMAVGVIVPSIGHGASAANPYHLQLTVTCNFDADSRPVIIAKSKITKPADGRSMYVDYRAALEGLGSVAGLDNQWGWMPPAPPTGWHTHRTGNIAPAIKAVSTYNIRWVGDDTWYGQSFRVGYQIRWRHLRYNKLTKSYVRDALGTTVFPTKGGWSQGVSNQVFCRNPFTPSGKPKDPNQPEPPPDGNPQADTTTPPPTDQPPPDATKVCSDGSVVLFNQFCPLPPGPS